MSDNLNTVYHPPAKLMRFELSSQCNYRCPFCYWQNNIDTQRYFTRDQIVMFCKELIKTRCRNINITGGEPLLLPQKYLIEVIESINSVEGINKLWVTTNGSMLYKFDLCRVLAKAGLKEAVVSIAAETDESYMMYTASTFDLNKLLQGIENAIYCGISVRVHVPLSQLGIKSFNQLEILLDKVFASGVTEAFYFGLHNSENTKDKFNELFIDPSIITDGFIKSNRWYYQETETGRPFFTDGMMRVYAPRDQIRLITQNCKSRNCGMFCQGIYSAYCIPDKQGWVLRACHKTFSDKNNEYPLDIKYLEHGQESKLYDLLLSLWGYAYEER